LENLEAKFRVHYQKLFYRQVTSQKLFSVLSVRKKLKCLWMDFDQIATYAIFFFGVIM